eukprot:jgi/Mesen1/8772/ME000524S08067
MAQCIVHPLSSLVVEAETASTSGRFLEISQKVQWRGRSSCKAYGKDVSHAIQSKQSSIYGDSLLVTCEPGRRGNGQTNSSSGSEYGYHTEYISWGRRSGEMDDSMRSVVCRAVAITGDFERKPRKILLSDLRSGGDDKETPKELLAQVRRRRELERLEREQEQSFKPKAENDSEVVWPYWRKKRSAADSEARQLTKKIVELGKRRQLDQVFQVLSSAKKERRTINLITMNAALGACVQCEDMDRAMALYKEMVKHKGVGADSITYGTLLKGLGQAKRLDDAFELLERMESGTAPGRPELTEVHLNTLMNACAEAGEALRARGLLQRYRAFAPGQGPSTLTYNLLIKGYARSDNPLEALKLVEEMQLLGLAPQRHTYNSLILACVRGGDLEKAIDLLEEMKADGRRSNSDKLLPDVVTYTTLLKGLAEDGDLDGVLQLAAEMKTAPSCAIDRVAYTAIVDACILAGSAYDGLRYMEEMEERARSEPQLKPRAHVFLAVMRAFAAKGDVDRTRALAQRFVRDAAGHVWPEDKAEANELVMEAAVHAGQYHLGRQALAAIIAGSEEYPQFSARGTHAWVRLMVNSGDSFDLFQPLIIRSEVSHRAPLMTLMHSIDDIEPLAPHESVREVLVRLQSEHVLPVVDSSNACVGVVYEEDCLQEEKRDALVRDIMRPAPPQIPHHAIVSQAANLLVQYKADLLAVVQGSGMPQGLVREYYGSDAGTSVLGFLLREDIFEVGSSRPASVEAEDLLRLEEEAAAERLLHEAGELLEEEEEEEEGVPEYICSVPLGGSALK